jgi:hypothetical protein
MSINVNAEQGKQEVVKGFKMHTGIAPFKVVAINPTKEQLNALGINAQKEPEYLNEDKVRLDIWLESVDLIGNKKNFRKFPIFLENKLRVNQAETKAEWINSFGIACWTKDGEDLNVPPSLDWFKQTGAKRAYVGESQLVNTFLRVWVNAAENDEVSIENWENIFRGNVTELKDLVKIFKDNVIRVMMTVRGDDKGNFYEDVYPYFFARWNITSVTGWAKHFKNSPPKANLSWSYDIQEFKPKMVKPDEDVAAENNLWT